MTSAPWPQLETPETLNTSFSFDMTLTHLAFVLVDINLSDEVAGTWGDEKNKTKELFEFLHLSFLTNGFYEQLLYINENQIKTK